MKERQYVPIKAAPISSIRDMTEQAVAEAADVIAYKYKENGGVTQVTYREFYDTTEALGASLCDIGLGSAHFSIISENSYRWIVVFLTALRTAGVFVPIYKELPDSDKVFLLCDSDSEVLFYSKKYAGFVKENRDSLPNIKYFICLDGGDDGALTYDELCRQGKDLDKSAYDSQRSDPDDLKLLVYTSGTTGIAKGVMLTEHNICSSVYYGMQVSQIYDTGLSVLPYNHVYESVCDILVTIHFHATLCINDQLKNVLSNIQLFKPSHIYLVPAFTDLFYAKIMQGIKKQGKEKKFRLAIKLSRAMLKLGIDLRPKLFGEILSNFGGRLRRIVCGGAPIRPEIGEFFGDIGISMTGGYGITECSPLVSLTRAGEKVVGVGKAIPGMTVMIVSIDEHKELPANEQGLIVTKGVSVFSGYLGGSPDPFLILDDGDKWYNTGDLGYLTPEGQLIITGRLKRFVKIGGEMISLPALESVLNHRWPSSDDKPLMAVESKEVEGERPELILFSVLEKITPDDANKALKEAGFGNIASISRVITIPEMPLLGTGKTDYRSLKSKIN